MSKLNPMHNAHVILGIILHHCPTGREQAFMSKKYNEILEKIYKDFETNTDLEAEKVMVGILNDGLKYGNWPWSQGAYGAGTTEEALAAMPEGTQTRTWGPWGEEGRPGV